VEKKKKPPKGKKTENGSERTKSFLPMKKSHSETVKKQIYPGGEKGWDARIDVQKKKDGAEDKVYG